MRKLEIKNGKTDLISDISLLIEQSQRHIAAQANSALTQLFWQIGKRINDEILLNTRADYGKQIVAFDIAYAKSNSIFSNSVASFS